MVIAQQPFCWKCITKISKYGQNEYSRALNASDTFQPHMGFWYQLYTSHITDAKVTDSDFQTSVDRVLSAFISLSLPITEIQEIKKQKTFPTEELENIKKQACDLQAELDQTKSDLQEKQSSLQSTEADLVSAREENKALTQEIIIRAKLQPFCILTSSPPHEIIRRSHDIERITNKTEEL